MNPERDERMGERNEQINAYLSGTMPPEESGRFESLLLEDAGLEGEVRRAREALDAAREWAAADAPDAREQAARLKIPQMSPTATALSLFAPNRETETRNQRGGEQTLTVERVSTRGRRARPALVRYLAAAALFAAGLLVGAALPRQKAADGGPQDSAESAAPGTADTALPALEPAVTPVPVPRVAPPRNPAARPRPALAEADGDAQESGNAHAGGNAQGYGGASAGKATLRVADRDSSAKPRIAPLRVLERDSGRLVLESTLEGSGGRATWVVDGSFRLAENNTGGV